jgi:alpha-N-arabinofuranosidase
LETEIVVRRASVASGQGQVLANGDLHAHNDLAHPDVVHPEPAKGNVAGGKLVHTFPAASVTALSLELA